MSQPIQKFPVQQTQVEVYQDVHHMGAAAARLAAALLRQAVQDRGKARIIVGTGPSQHELIRSLVDREPLDWSAIEVFHMDEYVGISDQHPASFRRWLRDYITGRVHVKAAHYLAGDAPDLDAECLRYSALVADPVDITFLGFGENGHIAFNDPHVANFHDPLRVKRVTIDRRCRLQQVGEGHFSELAAVPPEALTLTCPALLNCRTAFAFVPDRRKAEAVRDALEGPLSESCPASLTLTHPDAHIFLDRESASLLTRFPETRP